MKTFIRTLKWRSLFAAALSTTSLLVLAEGDEQAVRDPAEDLYQALNSMFKGDLEAMRTCGHTPLTPPIWGLQGACIKDGAPH